MTTEQLAKNFEHLKRKFDAEITDLLRDIERAVDNFAGETEDLIVQNNKELDDDMEKLQQQLNDQAGGNK